jgi:CheY-like chemotaxis protein
MGRVLVAEDEAMLALSIADVLEEAGYEVELAGDGAIALARARSMGCALVVLVTDLNMPVMSGEALIQALRRERPSLPIIVVTGSAPQGGAAELQRHAGGEGWLALLHKPFDFDELARSVAHALDAGR